ADGGGEAAAAHAHAVDASPQRRSYSRRSLNSGRCPPYEIFSARKGSGLHAIREKIRVLLAAQPLIEPGTGEGPQAIGGPPTDPQGLGRPLMRQPREEA